MTAQAPVKKRGRQAKQPQVPKSQGTVTPNEDEIKKLGRPSKYRDEFVVMLLEYFSQPPVKTITTVDKEGNTVEKTVPAMFPTLARFAANIGVTTETLHDWATAKNLDGTPKNAVFSYAYKKAKDLQQANLVEGTMAGAYNSTFAIFTAKNVLGWRDKIEQEITGKDGAPLAGIQVMFVNPDGTDHQFEH
jgi:hypothetical protein